MYADPIPDLKRLLASELVGVIAGWRQIDVAALMHTDAPRVSDLRRGKLERFSVESLVRFLKRMHRRVDVTIAAERNALRPYVRSKTR